MSFLKSSEVIAWAGLRFPTISSYDANFKLTVLCAPFFGNISVGNNNCHDAVLKGVSVDQNLVDKGRKSKDTLQLLRSDVLSLGQLENVLGSVDDSDCTVRIANDNITSAEPVSVEGFLGLVLSLVISREHRGSLHLELSTGEGLVS